MVYEYSCNTCKTRVEVQKSMKDSHTEEICVVCKNAMTMVVTGGTGFILKGTGWARDGYHSDHVTFKHKDGSEKTYPVKDKNILKGDGG